MKELFSISKENKKAFYIHFSILNSVIKHLDKNCSIFKLENYFIIYCHLVDMYLNT